MSPLNIFKNAVILLMAGVFISASALRYTSFLKMSAAQNRKSPTEILDVCLSGLKELKHKKDYPMFLFCAPEYISALLVYSRLMGRV